jgi:SAM-dependent methyltransferase
VTALYDRIGGGYAVHRRPDPRIALIVLEALADASTIVNLGAGVGSYEPRDRPVVAVEPSRVMIAQRARDAPPVVQAHAEALPFGDGAFDCAMAVLTIHHWSDVERGVREAARVARRRLVLLTWVGFPTHFWLLDYFPEIASLDASLFPTADKLAAWLGPLRTVVVPIPHDCTDGFLCAYWRRPEAYLDAGVRGAISVFARLPDTASALPRLEADLTSGVWRERYGDVLQRTAMDFGYRLVVCDRPVRVPVRR